MTFCSLGNSYIGIHAAGTEGHFASFLESSVLLAFSYLSKTADIFSVALSDAGQVCPDCWKDKAASHC